MNPRKGVRDLYKGFYRGFYNNYYFMRFSVRMAIYQLPPASPPPCPKQIPQDPFWVPWALPGLPFGSPWASPGCFLVPLGTSWSPLGPLLAPGRKKKRKVTWRTLAPESKLGLKIVTFLKKAATNMKKWAPRQGLENRPCLEGVETLKVMPITTLFVVF